MTYSERHIGNKRAKIMTYWYIKVKTFDCLVGIQCLSAMLRWPNEFKKIFLDVRDLHIMYATWISNLCLNNQHLVTQGKQQIRAGGGLIFSSFVRLTPTPPVNFIKKSPFMDVACWSVRHGRTDRHASLSCFVVLAAAPVEWSRGSYLSFIFQ